MIEFKDVRSGMRVYGKDHGLGTIKKLEISSSNRTYATIKLDNGEIVFKPIDMINQLRDNEEKRMICDCCEQDFEKSYFCEKCSNKYIGIKMVETPKLIYDYGNEMEWTEEDQFSGNICGNCCACHLKGGVD